LSGILSDSDRK